MTTSKWVFYGVIYSALVAVLLAALMLWQMAHTNTDSQIRTQSSTAHSAPNPLEALIRNQLKIFEQSIVLPPHLTLHGKPCREPRYRLDDGHRLPSPHIGRSSRVERPTAHQSSQPHRAPETQPAESAEPETVQVSSGERDGVEHDSTSSQTSAASDSQSAGTVTTPDPSAASAIPLPNGLRHFIKAAQNSGEGKREHDDGPHTANRTGTTPHALEQESLLDRALHRVHGAQS